MDDQKQLTADENYFYATCLPDKYTFYYHKLDFLIGPEITRHIALQSIPGFLAPSAVLKLLCDNADALNHFDGGYRTVVGVNATAGIFGTFPQPYVSILVGFADQVGLHLCTQCIKWCKLNLIR